MFLSPIAARSKALRPSSLRLTRLLQQCRAQSTFLDEKPYWEHIPSWSHVSTDEFVSYRWQLRNTVSDKHKLYRFLSETLPDKLGPTENDQLKKITTKQAFIEDAVAAIQLAPMAIRLTPHILSRVDWANPLDDPVRRQFLPLRSGIVPDHEKLTLDSLHEEDDSPVPGLVHRYPGRALFLATSICPVYCRFCTRSYAVGPKTEIASKRPQKPSRKRWEVIFQYIENHQDLQDIVVSGGDAYYLAPDDLKDIGERLLNIPHVRRVRFASKGLAVAPGRFLDETDPWSDTLIDLSKQGRSMGKQVCLHTHINHANEITWVTRKAANRLFEHGVIVRNQAVLLNGVNNSPEALSELITTLSNINIQPYYIYQCDMVSGIEDLRTPLHEIIKLDKQLRGTFSGFMMPSFVVDLPGGGGKRLVSTYDSYDKKTGVAEYSAPGLPGVKGTRKYNYYDPKHVQAADLEEFRQHQHQALAQGISLSEFARATYSNSARPQSGIPTNQELQLPFGATSITHEWGSASAHAG
ncbi:kama family protein [Cucurbitaria berberidis CBS 394.84]|uniref:Kama family protein n=1 Tax=Cucurbitaria berberidis CBS 394.84 TaxID=1168544 RepID=A0A9P4GUF2_9PLEO|nr:kama family protein [Cucurbitaria berberidis CBS 394.84]KAF1851970.1 kama family protein [Cucurbitaria berberidis CBS 394.84]